MACNGTKTNAVDDAPAQKIASKAEFNADSAYSYVKAQVDFGPRVPGSKAHSDCGRYIAGSLESFGADTVIMHKATTVNSKGETIPVTNIMARYNIDEPHRVLLLAHWDSRPWADNDPDPANHNRPVPGANDGASGTGILLELARLFGNERPAAGVDLLFVDGEDSGTEAHNDSWCLGTQEWIKQMPYKVADRPVYGILLDMVGGRDARFTREYVSEQYARAVNDRVWAMANASGYGDIFVNRQAGGVIDDHMFINQAGIPCIDIIECANESTGSFPTAWHTVNDDMTYIDPATLKAVGQTVANVVYNEQPRH